MVFHLQIFENPVLENTPWAHKSIFTFDLGGGGGEGGLFYFYYSPVGNPTPYLILTLGDFYESNGGQSHLPVNVL